MSSFLQFLKLEENNIEIIKSKKQDVEIIKPETVIKDKIVRKKFSFNKVSDNELKVKQMDNPNHNTFNEFFFKKGNFVKIVRTERKYKINETGDIEFIEKGTRLCDLYCGYIGEIKQFFKGNDRAIVTLYAPNNLPSINFPIDCLQKIE
jgi:hypothetical protein